MRIKKAITLSMVTVVALVGMSLVSGAAVAESTAESAQIADITVDVPDEPRTDEGTGARADDGSESDDGTQSEYEGDTCNVDDGDTTDGSVGTQDKPLSQEEYKQGMAVVAEKSYSVVNVDAGDVLDAEVPPTSCFKEDCPRTATP